MTRRHDRGGMRDQDERFFYDSRDRLTRTDRRFNGGTWQVKQRQRYDISGNIICKSDVSATSCTGTATNYSYGAGSAGPHAVTQAGSRTFVYDANGNVSSDRNSGVLDRTFAYTSYDKVRKISRGNRQIEFHYGAVRAPRSRSSAPAPRSSSAPTMSVRSRWSTKAPWPASNAGAFRRYIERRGDRDLLQGHGGIDQTRYQHTDHLGSVTALSDEGGQIAAQMAFDPWGQRRNGNDWNTVWQQWTTGMTPVWAQSAIDITPRGYTGHEHVDEMGIIHMNGRIYDALLGRFLQADPFVEDTTTLNRYTYVHNNPLSLTDPSGFFSFKKFFRTAVSIAITAYAPGILSPFIGKFAAIVSSGGLAGFVATGSVEGALVGAFTAGVFHGIGQGFSALPPDSALRGSFLGSDFSALGLTLKSVSHGLAGGVLSSVQGGKFVHGFSAAGVAQFASGGIDLIGGEGFSPVRIAAAAVLGGTVSEISGGKFANGAVTGAFSRAFNDEIHRPVHPQTVCQLNCHGVDYSQHRYATDEELFWLNATTIAIDLAIPLPPMIAGGKLVTSIRGGATAVRVGRAGEDAVRATFNIGSKEFIRINGRGRIPDGLTANVLSEVKNVISVSFTRQLRDFSDFAQQTGRRFDLFVRPNTRVSGPLQDAIDSGLIQRVDIPQ